MSKKYNASIIELLHRDCMEYMQSLPDNYFDMAITDPPYGIGQDWRKRNKKTYTTTTYQNTPVNQEYFNELKRVSRYQIIWGYNYYSHILGPTNYLIIWDKCSSNNQVFKYSKAEIAYTTFKIPCNLVSIVWDGYRMGSETGQKKIHPHQKPIALYEWLLNNYAQEGWHIFDSHVGSGSSAIAAANLNYKFTGCEIDEYYYTQAQERLFKATQQNYIF